MNEKYSDCIEKVSQILFETIAKREENLKGKIFEIDTDLLSLLRAIGLRVMSMLLTMLIIQVTNQIKKPGWKIRYCSPQQSNFIENGMKGTILVG